MSKFAKSQNLKRMPEKRSTVVERFSAKQKKRKKEDRIIYFYAAVPVPLEPLPDPERLPKK